MRLSTNTIYQSGVNRLLSLQSAQAQLQEKISTGKEVSKPSDNPVAAARILELSNSKQVNQSYADTRKVARTSLDVYETSLNSVTNALLSVQSSITSAGNGSYTDSERKYIGQEVQTAYDTLLNMANTKDANGNYLYAGFKSDSPAFDSNAVYQGDSSQLKMQVDGQRQMGVTFTGDNVFLSNDIFTQLKNMITALNTPVTSANQAAYSATLSTSLGSVKGTLDNVLNVRAEVGSKLNELEALDTTGTDLDLQFDKSLSSIQDLDYTKALSELSKQNTILEAAQKSFVNTTQLSLFQYIQ